MQKKLLILFLVTSFIGAYGQKEKPKDQFYLWTEKWEPTRDIKKTTYFARVKPITDSSWQWDTYKISGPIMSSEQFKDKTGQHAHGRQIFYHASGFIDSIGNFIEEVPDGDWVYCNDTGRVITQKKYEKGRLISVIDKLALKDPVPDKDAVIDGEKESSFPGGSKNWVNYMIKKLVYPKSAEKAKIEGKVIVDFVIDTQGNIEGLHLSKSVEFTVDEESLKLIAGSPKWHPATKDGKKVKSFKRQPLIFAVP